MPTIKIKSNFSEFAKRIRQIPELIDEAMRFAVEEVLERMQNDMKNEIESMRSVWLEKGSQLDYVDSIQHLGNDIEYEISGNSGIIYVGRNTMEIEMKDGRMVNPYFFIEFGYGIVGADNPVQYSSQSGWAYNVNGHRNSWSYAAWDSNPDDPRWIHTKGRRGIDFFYRITRKYRENWKELAEAAIKEKLG